MNILFPFAAFSFLFLFFFSFFFFNIVGKWIFCSFTDNTHYGKNRPVYREKYMFLGFLEISPTAVQLKILDQILRIFTFDT